MTEHNTTQQKSCIFNLLRGKEISSQGNNQCPKGCLIFSVATIKNYQSLDENEV